MGAGLRGRTLEIFFVFARQQVYSKHQHSA